MKDKDQANRKAPVEGTEYVEERKCYIISVQSFPEETTKELYYDYNKYQA